MAKVELSIQADYVIGVLEEYATVRTIITAFLQLTPLETMKKKSLTGLTRFMRFSMISKVLQVADCPW